MRRGDEHAELLARMGPEPGALLSWAPTLMALALLASLAGAHWARVPRIVTGRAVLMREGPSQAWRAEVEIDPRAAGQVEVGQAVELALDDLAGSPQRLRGRVCSLERARGGPARAVAGPAGGPLAAGPDVTPGERRTGSAHIRVGESSLLGWLLGPLFGRAS